MARWERKTHKQIKERIFAALDQNVNFYEENSLGMPASHLDAKVFTKRASFLIDAPFISTLIHNPNHIGCHTYGESIKYFSGTQELERELLAICACDILKGEEGGHDGYVTSGGTEANIVAVWIFRNYFMEEYQAKLDDLAVLCSDDSHYSIDKAANILSLDIIKIPVNEETRMIEDQVLVETVQRAKRQGKKFFIVVANMMTTMFGSVDDVDQFASVLRDEECPFKIHVDGAFGGFFYPFSQPENQLNFKNPNVHSIVVYAHKMAQAPYGTGIFLVRKGYIQYARTKEATYIEGQDYTLVGSRSGANAIAVWMILMSHGPYSWKEKIYILLKRTEWLCENLSKCGVEYYRHPKSNIVTIKADFIDHKTAEEFELMPDDHQHPKWYKIVIMDHVNIENLLPLVQKIGARRAEKKKLSAMVLEPTS